MNAIRTVKTLTLALLVVASTLLGMQQASAQGGFSSYTRFEHVQIGGRMPQPGPVFMPPPRFPTPPPRPRPVGHCFWEYETVIEHGPYGMRERTRRVRVCSRY